MSNNNEDSRLELSGYNGMTERLDDFQDPNHDKKVYDLDSTSFTMTCVDELQSGDFAQITITPSPSIANPPVLIYESSDFNVVTVDRYGIVVAKNEGTATITATDVESGYKQSIEISVYFDKTEGPVYEVSNAFTYVHDEASFNESKANGGLKLYYEAYPTEDLWNETENRAANFNDRHYIGTIDGVNVESDAKWVSENTQSITVDDVTYYMAIFYHFDPCECELFNDAELTESANKTFIISSTSYAHCTNCWNGAVNAPGSTVPWIVPYFTEDVNAKIIFRYEGKEDVYPWGDKIFGASRSWGVASIAKELGISAADFDITKFQMVLERQG